MRMAFGDDPMTLPETDLARIRRWIGARNDRLPPRAVDQIRYELDVDTRSVTILERRPPWREDFGAEWTRHPVARLRYTKARQEWTLYSRDRNLKFHRYDIADPSPDVESLLAEVDADPTCIFSG